MQVLQFIFFVTFDVLHTDQSVDWLVLMPHLEYLEESGGLADGIASRDCDARSSKVSSDPV